MNRESFQNLFDLFFGGKENLARRSRSVVFLGKVSLDIFFRRCCLAGVSPEGARKNRLLGRIAQEQAQHDAGLVAGS